MKKLFLTLIFVSICYPIGVFSATDLKEKTFNEIDTFQDTVSVSIDDQKVFRNISQVFSGVEHFRNEIKIHFKQRIEFLKKTRNQSILEQSFNIVDGKVQLDKPKEENKLEKSPIGENFKRFFIFIELLWSLLMYKIFSQAIIFYTVFGLILIAILRTLFKKIITTYRRRRIRKLPSVR